MTGISPSRKYFRNRIKGGGGTEEEFPDDVPHVIPGLDGQQGTQVSGFPRPQTHWVRYSPFIIPASLLYPRRVLYLILLRPIPCSVRLLVLGTPGFLR